MKEEQKNKRILIIEDEPHIAEGLELNLNLQGYQVVISKDGMDGLQKWKEFSPHLIVLDLMLPGIDGYSILQKVRLEDSRLPVLILSAKDRTEDKVKGFNYGVDDYLVKPFNLDEFLLRVQRLITKADWYHTSEDVGSLGSYNKEEYSFGENQINFKTGMALCNGESILLTVQEQTLLKLFIANPGQPLSRETLLKVAWGYAKDTSTRTLDNFIVRFRKYFEQDPKNPVFFKSLRSIGYVFNPHEGENQ